MAGDLPAVETARKAAVGGLGAGLGIWFPTMLFPIFSGFEPQFLNLIYPTWLDGSQSVWAAATMISIAVNTGVFVVVSL